MKALRCSTSSQQDEPKKEPTHLPGDLDFHSDEAPVIAVTYYDEQLSDLLHIQLFSHFIVKIV
jgi:hypothetical protein